MNEKAEELICPKCKKKISLRSPLDQKIYPNRFGKFCLGCGFYFEPEKKDILPIIKEIEEKKKNDQIEIRNYLKKKNIL